RGVSIPNCVAVSIYNCARQDNDTPILSGLLPAKETIHAELVISKNIDKQPNNQAQLHGHLLLLAEAGIEPEEP
ncbi:MAG: hypothetical protein RXR20_02950, partial [Paraburkholderia sp.]